MEQELKQLHLAIEKGGETLTEVINQEEKDYFSVEEENTEIEIVTEGVIRRMDKETGNIWFIRGETKISCSPSNKLVKEKCISLFDSKCVKIEGKAITNPKGQILRITIDNIEDSAPKLPGIQRGKD